MGRRFAWGVLTLFAMVPACESFDLKAPDVIEVEESWVYSDRPTPITIRGERFYLRVATAVVPDEATTVARAGGFSADLDGVALESVEWVSNTELSAVVPAGLPPGQPTITVTRPDQKSDFLPNAVEVLRPEWQAVDVGQTADLRAIDGADGWIWIAGEQGTILYFDGSEWATESAVTSEDLYGVRYVDNYVYVIGALGSFFRKYRGNWIDLGGDTEETLRGIDGCT